MKIVLTGSEGFIGSHLKKELSNTNLELYDIKLGKNIKDFKLKGNEDFVIHLAAKTSVRNSIIYPDLYFLNNYIYSKKIFQECDNYGIRCIYASSSCALFPELSPYGLSKKMMEEAGKNHIGLRFTNVFGVPPRENMLMDKIIRNKLTYKTEHKRDFIFIEDVISAIRIFLKKDSSFNSIYNVSFGESFTISSLLDLINLNVPTKKGLNCESKDNVLDNSELLKLGWRPTVSIKDFIKTI